MTQKILFKNSKDLTLTGSLWNAPSNNIIIMAHGSGSNRFARGLFEKIAQDLQQINYNVLAFDFSGHGESDDVIFNTARSIDDISAAITYAKEHGYKRIALFGHSFGSLSCLKAYTPDIETMVLLGALVGPVHWEWRQHYTSDQLDIIRKNGYITSEVNDGLRNTIKTDVHIFDEILAIDQKRLLGPIKCPVLIIHGDDQDELNLLEFSKKALPLLPHGSKLEVIHGASHLFLEHINQVIALTKNWYQEHFKLY